jgi:glycosyltransferase involved in cell wall biosynthesis
MTVSGFSRQRLSAVLGVAPARLALVTLGGDHLGAVAADDAALATLGLRQRPFFLAVGSNSPTKNHASLLAAYAQWTQGATEPAAALVLVGGRNARVFARAATAPDPPGVLRVGAQSDAVLKSLYGHAIALVFPSSYEGFGIPPLEAMLQACPVIAASAASLPEVCGEAALYVDPQDTVALALALQQVAQDGAVRQRLQEAGSIHVKRYAWASSARQLLAALQPMWAQTE